VIIVDDSAFMRKSLQMMLESDPGIKVIATANNGKDGVEKIKSLRPDLVTMDIEMPVMDGLTALKIIMKENPLPVLMVSSLTTDGATATLEALDAGAVDFIPKQLSFVSLDIVRIKEDLISKVKSIVHSKGLQFRLERIRGSVARSMAGGIAATPAPKRTKPLNRPSRTDFRAVVLGISTGGPFALMKTIPSIPGDFPIGILVVQHMPPNFTHSLAERLNSLSKLNVVEAADGDRIEPGRVLIAPGGKHLHIVKNGIVMSVRVSAEPANTLYRPSADVMFKSAVESYGAPLLGVIMTGMGRDGCEGLKLLKQKGGYVIAQNEDTCIVYGMPKAAVDEGVADEVVALEEIPSSIVDVVIGAKK
jgi:two-component system chemotaxis response regulator CheB